MKRHKKLKAVKVSFEKLGMIGWTAETNNRGVGFHIFNHEGREVAHYILLSRSLWLHPADVVTERRECRNLQQAVRYAYLKTLPEIVPDSEVKSNRILPTDTSSSITQ